MVTADSVILDVKGISKQYRFDDRSVQAVKEVSFQVNEGELVALLGPSGSGKTTALSIVGGLLTPDHGVVTVRGEDPYALRADQRAAWRAERIGFLFQQFNLLPYLSALENVCAQGLAHPRSGMEGDARKLLEQFGLGERLHHPPGRLSSGEQQRVALARAVVGAPDVLLADEPTGNLDDDTAKQVCDLLRARADGGDAVLVVTHDPRAAGMADRVVTMKQGQLVQSEGEQK